MAAHGRAARSCLGQLLAEPPDSRQTPRFAASAYALHQQVFGRALLILALFEVALSVHAAVEGRSGATLGLRIASAGFALAIYALLQFLPALRRLN